MNNILGKIRTMNKKALYTIAGVAAVAVLGGGTLVFGKSETHAVVPKAETPLATTTITVQPKRIDSVVEVAGVLSSKNSSVLSSKVMGRVSSLGVHEGDQVSAGKLLMRIESGEITAQTIQAQAAYNNAKLQYDRIKGLYDAAASTKMEMDQATLGIETAQAGLAAAKAMESYTAITAPITGQIVEKRINLGEMALPGQPMLKIEDNRHLQLETTVKEQDILAVRPGQKVIVRIDAMPGRDLTGTVGQVVPASDVRTHSFLVKIDVPAERGLITGMYGKAFLRTGVKEAITVPSSAMVELSGITGVYVVAGSSEAIFQMVQLGPVHGDSVEVLTGLKKGDIVVTDNRLGRIEGRKIQIAKQ